MIVTIDGPAGAGKSSAALALAERLGFEILDTGAMYRAVALAALRRQVPLDDATGLETVLQSLNIQMTGSKILLQGEDVSELIRTPEVSVGASVVAANSAVREHLVLLQREIARGRDMVCEGRDQGTVVFPDAECKFFLLADPEERLRRRAEQLKGKGQVVDLDQLRRDQAERDARDANRALAPLRPAEDAVVLDSSTMTLEEVVDRMEQEVQRRRSLHC